MGNLAPPTAKLPAPPPEIGSAAMVTDTELTFVMTNC
jgi:hypothetical protein